MMDDLFSPVDIYCERTAHGLLAEPLNAVSNVAFFIAALMLWRQYKQHKLDDWPVAILITLVLFVAIGSTLFHTFANTLAMYSDIIPIMGFACFYIWLAMRRLMGLRWRRSLSLLVLFIYSGVMAGRVPPEFSLNGSIAYLPCLIAIILVGAFLKAYKQPAANAMLFAAIIFIGSFTFRSLDMAMCEQLPIGMHYVWHILNGALLYLLTNIMISHCARHKNV